MVATPTIEMHGKHTISMKLNQGKANALILSCGVVREGAAASCNHFEKDSMDGWFMSSGGLLHGNGKGGEDYAGAIKAGQVICVQHIYIYQLQR
jgi:hypothetical protein